MHFRHARRTTATILQLQTSNPFVVIIRTIPQYSDALSRSIMQLMSALSTSWMTKRSTLTACFERRKSHYQKVSAGPLIGSQLKACSLLFQKIHQQYRKTSTETLLNHLPRPMAHSHWCRYQKFGLLSRSNNSGNSDLSNKCYHESYSFIIRGSRRRYYRLLLTLPSGQQPLRVCAMMQDYRRSYHTSFAGSEKELWLL